MSLTNFEEEVSALRALVLAQQQHIAALEGRCSEIQRIKREKRTVHAEFANGTLYIRFYDYTTEKQLHVCLASPGRDWFNFDMDDAWKENNTLYRFRISGHCTYHIGPYYASHRCLQLRVPLEDGGRAQLFFYLDYDVERDTGGSFLPLFLDMGFHEDGQGRGQVLRICQNQNFTQYLITDETKRQCHNALQHAVAAWGIPQDAF